MPRYIGAYRGGVRPSAPTTVYRTCALSLPCHSEPVTDVTGVGIRPPRPGAESPCLPLRGIVIAGRGRAPPLHTSADSLCAIRAGGCGHPPLRTVSGGLFVGGDAHIAPPLSHCVSGGQRRPPLPPPTEHTPFHKTSPSFYHISPRRATSPPAPALCKPILSPISSTIRLLRAKLAQIYAKYARLAPGRNCKPPL